MKPTRIKPAKFRFGRYVLSEEEVRQLMLEVLQGKRPAGIIIKDEKNISYEILSDGSMKNTPFGWGKGSNITLDIIRERAGIKIVKQDYL